jgi:hypothetical protein
MATQADVGGPLVQAGPIVTIDKPQREEKQQADSQRARNNASAVSCSFARDYAIIVDF